MLLDSELAIAAKGWIAAARTAWPAIVIDEAAYVGYVKDRLVADVDLQRAREIHAADLWLASACAAGDPGALAVFDDQYLALLDHVPAKTGLAHDRIEEVKQELRCKLLVASDDAPRIADYSGRADLRTWLRTSAVRCAIDLIRREREVPVDDEELVMVAALDDDPELTHLKRRYRTELREAIGDAVAAIEPRDRLILKYHYIDGLGIDRISAICGIHRATAARWVIAAREALAHCAQRLLLARLGVSTSELRSIARLVESQLDLSLRRFLA